MHRVIKSIANIIKRTLQPFLDSFLGFTKCTTKCVDKYFENLFICRNHNVNVSLLLSKISQVPYQLNWLFHQQLMHHYAGELG